MNSDGLKVSVAMCAHNGSASVQEQLRSILNQTRPPDEVIVCDDQSTDDTAEIVERFIGKKNSAVRLIRNDQNLRMNKNFEKAISCTTGDVVFLSDCDDVWFQDRVATMLAPFQSNSRVGLVYCNGHVTDARLEPLGATLFDVLGRYQLHRRRSVHEVISGNHVRGCMIAFRSVLKDVIPPIPSSEIWGFDYWIAFLGQALMDVVPIQKCLMYYRRHEKNYSSFELGKLRDYKTGLAATATTARYYTKDRLRWETMIARLQEIAGQSDLAWVDHPQLDTYLAACEKRLGLARSRERLKREDRIKRLLPATRRLLAGDYHRYCRGLKTFAKDILIA